MSPTNPFLPLPIWVTGTEAEAKQNSVSVNPFSPPPLLENLFTITFLSILLRELI